MVGLNLEVLLLLRVWGGQYEWAQDLVCSGVLDHCGYIAVVERLAVQYNSRV